MVLRLPISGKDNLKSPDFPDYKLDKEDKKTFIRSSI